MDPPILLLDCGDTLVDEATEVKDASGATLKADLVPGAADLVRGLVRLGYRLGLVADGPTATFRNVLGHHGLWDCFSAFAISEEVGAEKPARQMFTAALEALKVGPRDYGSVMMVGNNLERDIAGANALGLISVWLSWSPRRSHVPRGPEEVPRFTVATPLQVLTLLGHRSDEPPPGT